MVKMNFINNMIWRNYQILILTILLSFEISFISCMAALGEESRLATFKKSHAFMEYGEMESILESLAQSDSNITVSQIGKADKSKLPIYLVSINNKNVPEDRKLRVMIIARVHGSEPAGMEAMISFIRDLSDGKKAETKAYLANFSFYIIPCLNPDGAQSSLKNYLKTGGYWDKTGRTNGKGIDINRDYHALNASETRAGVEVFNKVSPHVVIDLHEFSSTPLVADEGWWRGKYYDIFLGAGRHPDVYPPIAHFARMICENAIFPTLKSRGIRVGYYPSEGGDFGTTYHFGVTAADYFNLRNSITFLIETGCYDRGEETLQSRVKLHLLTVDLILGELSKNQKIVREMVDHAKKFASERETITLRQKSIPVEVEIDGVKSASHTFQTDFSIDGKIYHSKVNVNFRAPDPNPDAKESLDLPSGYLVISPQKDFIEKLMLHGIKIYEAMQAVRSKNATIPAHAFYVPCDQESSAIIGFVLDQKAIELNRFALKERVIVAPVELSLDLKNFRLIRSPDEIPDAIRRFDEFMERIMKKEGVEDKKEDG